ncbi:MAG TPA: N-acetylmuramoyl-L-alanine amidase, partial [Telluria sp.]|nr:N-acetylmuramoyl-L-alanine amidase [Telluria sp.]
MPRPPDLRTEPVSAPFTRRTVLKAGGTLLLSVLSPMKAMAAQILAVRVWPAPDYTRVTLENDSALKTTHFIVQNPERLVVDIEGLDLNPTLKSLVAKIQSNDPYIKQVRVGQNRPSVVRLVFDLKEEIKPQVFTLAPVGEYKHRLIFDLYPVKPVDPIAAMIEKGEWTRDPDAPIGRPELPTAPDPMARQETEMPAMVVVKPEPKVVAKAEPGAPKVARLITIALDPGHGGEDPGALGASGSREKDIVLSIAKRLKFKLEELPNVRVMLTRDGDYFVPLGTRVDKARKVQAD